MRKPSDWYSAGKETIKNLCGAIKEQVDESKEAVKEHEARKANEAEEDKASTKEDPGIVIDFDKIFPPDWRYNPPEPAPGPRPAIPKEIKRVVWDRDGGRCVQCGSKQNLEFDHDIPFSLGGSSSVNNLQILCRTCNRRKGARI